MDFEPSISEEERTQRRVERAARRREKQRQRRKQLLRRILPVAGVAGLLILFSAGFALSHHKSQAVPAGSTAAASAEPVKSDPLPPIAAPTRFSAERTAQTRQFGEEIDSDYAILIDVNNRTVLAEKASDTVISPASMTKILTVLVAAEQIADWDATSVITREITDYCYKNHCSVAGFELDEQVPVTDLLYGTILPSGADAALALANYVSGSQEAFVELMNQKAEALGLSETAHFTNCVGLYDEAHHCTVYDMAVILHAAVENELCRKVLSAHIYTTSATAQHPNGMVLSNWFLRRIEDHCPAGMEVLCAKTGYVTQSGSCSASYAEDTSGNGYLCVTGKAGSSWRCIFDHTAIYQQVAPAESNG